VFGGEISGRCAVLDRGLGRRAMRRKVQALTNAIVGTLSWIHSHSAEEIMAKMPEETVGKDKAALSRGR